MGEKEYMPELLNLSNKELDPLVYAADSKGLSILAIYQDPCYVVYVDRNEFVAEGTFRAEKSSEYTNIQMMVAGEVKRLNEQ